MTDQELIASPMLWIYHPFLSVIRESTSEMGIVHASNQLAVFIGNLWVLAAQGGVDIRDLPVLFYRDVAALLAAGWRVEV